MTKSTLTIRIVNLSGHDAAMIVQDGAQDPHAHHAWQQVTSDLVTQLLLIQTSSGGSLAMGQLSDTFRSGDGEIYLLHDADSGDLMLSASSAPT